MRISEVHRALSEVEALSYLAENPGARPIAGGTDVLVAMRGATIRGTGELPGSAGVKLVDVSGLSELSQIRREDDKLVIGAVARLSAIEASPLVIELAPVMAAAVGCIGSVQIRNRATLGGNIMNASPAADSLPALAVHNAVCVLRSSTSERRVPLGSLIKGAYSTCARDDELLVQVELENCPAWKHSHIKLGRRQAMAISRLAVAVIACFEGGAVTDIRISAGAAFPIPGRIGPAEERLRGVRYDSEVPRWAGETAADEMVKATGIRWSTQYKQPVLAALVERAVRQCAAREGLDQWPE